MPPMAHKAADIAARPRPAMRPDAPAERIVSSRNQVSSQARGYLQE